jgi:hypothetical protein
VLSDQSRQNLIEVFERAARASLLRSEEHSWNISREAANAAAAPAGSGPLLVITTSSFRFRLLTIFSVPDSEANRAYFIPAGSELTIHEGFAEVANLCCGALNREISNIYSHLAMSVPSRLSSECLGHLTVLAPAFISRSLISINGTVQVGVTLCMCCTAPVEIPALTVAAEQASGALEMF